MYLCIVKIKKDNIKCCSIFIGVNICLVVFHKIISFKGIKNRWTYGVRIARLVHLFCALLCTIFVFHIYNNCHFQSTSFHYAYTYVQKFVQYVQILRHIFVRKKEKQYLCHQIHNQNCDNKLITNSTFALQQKGMCEKCSTNF